MRNAFDPGVKWPLGIIGGQFLYDLDHRVMRNVACIWAVPENPISRTVGGGHMVLDERLQGILVSCYSGLDTLIQKVVFVNVAL